MFILENNEEVRRQFFLFLSSFRTQNKTVVVCSSKMTQNDEYVPHDLGNPDVNIIRILLFLSNTDDNIIRISLVFVCFYIVYVRLKSLCLTGSTLRQCLSIYQLSHDLSNTIRSGKIFLHRFLI